MPSGKSFSASIFSILRKRKLRSCNNVTIKVEKNHPLSEIKMKLFISLLISFHIISAPVLAGVGEKEEFSMKAELISAMTEAEANVFRDQVRSGLSEVAKSGLDQFLTTNLKDLTAEETTALKDIQKLTKNTTPKFREVKPGEWLYKEKGHTVTFTLLSLHQGHIFLDGEKFDFAESNLAQLKTKLENWEPTKKKTVFNHFNNLFGIGDAEALGPAILIVGLFAAAIIGYALYKFKWQPEASVKKINEIKARLEKKKEACETSPDSIEGFDQAVDLVKPSYSHDDKFDLALKQMITSSAINGDSCYDAAHQVGKAIKTDVPKLTEQQKNYLELNGGGNKFVKETDVKGALYDMCRSFNQLRNCMSTFAAKNVNNEQFKVLDDDVKEKLRSITPAASQQ